MKKSKETVKELVLEIRRMTEEMGGKKESNERLKEELKGIREKIAKRLPFWKVKKREVEENRRGKWKREEWRE